ncbi:hypothetical protein NDN08_006569 [Rhodosorus marinus]|uniref:Dolichol kinase n=1 Tax=Rhodosorus marinus TaxID=101924 RepID=A0AAV8UL17_9RHOD|nr:hypothetical protein NDN08_006569 [Rhodosorus marinus]
MVWRLPKTRSLCWIGVVAVLLQCDGAIAIIAGGLLLLSVLIRSRKELTQRFGFLAPWIALAGFVTCVSSITVGVLWKAHRQGPYISYESASGWRWPIIVECISLGYCATVELFAVSDARKQSIADLLVCPTVLSLLGRSATQLFGSGRGVWLAVAAAALYMVACITSDTNELPPATRLMISVVTGALPAIAFVGCARNGLHELSTLADTAFVLLLPAAGYQVGGGRAITIFKNVRSDSAIEYSLWIFAVLRSTAQLSLIPVYVTILMIPYPLLAWRRDHVRVRSLVLLLSAQLLLGTIEIFSDVNEKRPVWQLLGFLLCSGGAVSSGIYLGVTPRSISPVVGWMSTVLSLALLLVESELIRSGSIGSDRVLNSTIVGLLSLVAARGSLTPTEVDLRWYLLSARFYASRLPLLMTSDWRGGFQLYVIALCLCIPWPLYLSSDFRVSELKRTQAPSGWYFLRVLVVMLTVRSIVSSSAWAPPAIAGLNVFEQLVATSLFVLTFLIHPFLVVLALGGLLLRITLSSPGAMSGLIIPAYHMLRFRKAHGRGGFLFASSVLGASLCTAEVVYVRMKMTSPVIGLAVWLHTYAAWYTFLSCTMPTYEQLIQQTGRERIQRTSLALVGIAVVSLLFLYPSLSSFVPAVLWSGQAAFEGNWMSDSLACFAACYAVMAMALYMRTCLHEPAHRSKDLQFLPFASYVLAALSNLSRSSGASSVSPVVYAPILLLNTPPQFLLSFPHRAEKIHFLLPLLGLSLAWSTLTIRPMTSEIVIGLYIGVSVVSIGGAVVELALLIIPWINIVYFISEHIYTNGAFRQGFTFQIMVLSSVLPILLGREWSTMNLGILSMALDIVAAISKSSTTFNLRWAV